MALGAQPSLTSVDMCLEEVGRVAAEMLLAAIADEPARGMRTVPCPPGGTPVQLLTCALPRFPRL